MLINSKTIADLTSGSINILEFSDHFCFHVMDPKALIRQLQSVKILTIKQTRFIVGFLILSLILLIFYAECFIIVFDIAGGHSSFYNLLLSFAVFLLFNILFNLLCTFTSDPSITNLMLVQRLGPDWSYCIRCGSVRPPRAHHCRTCDVCIIRFDHHCSILGKNFLLLVSCLLFYFQPLLCIHI